MLSIDCFSWMLFLRIRGCSCVTFLGYVAWVYVFDTILLIRITKYILCVIESVILIWYFCQWSDAGNAGQGFSVHVIAVAAGEVCIFHCLWILLLDFGFLYLLAVPGKYSDLGSHLGSVRVWNGAVIYFFWVYLLNSLTTHLSSRYQLCCAYNLQIPTAL